jgi:nucleoside-diphosphate-sugar epimerase
MARVVVIGGSGHVGTWLVPRLVEAGHEVVNLARGRREPYRPDGRWRWVETVAGDRDAEDRAGTFGGKVAGLRPEIVIDMICFRLDSARHLAEALDGRVAHFLHCGTIWVHGPSVAVPASEAGPRRPFGEYGIQKAAIEAYLLGEARVNGLPATIVHPGHIVGPGWAPLNPAGNFNPRVFTKLARGEELALPNFGLETVHHVHADDVAQMFMRAIASRSAAVGEAFHTVSPAAVTLRGYAETVAAWFGHEARLKFLPFAEWKAGETPEDAAATWEHIARSPNASIAKAERLLGYRPRYTSFEAVQEAVAWLIREGIVETR